VCISLGVNHHNQGGENKESLEKHIAEHHRLIIKLLPYNGDEGHMHRLNAIKSIQEGREASLVELNDMDIDIVSSRTKYYTLYEADLDTLENNH
jgi:hypothetical protein